MPFFRVEIKRGGTWQLLHGRVETRSEADAIGYVKQILPKRCEGHELRAKEVPAERRLAHMHRAAMAAGEADG